jgi:Zn-dependent protease
MTDPREIDEKTRYLENLRAVYASLQQPPPRRGRDQDASTVVGPRSGAPDGATAEAHAPSLEGTHRKRNGALAAILTGGAFLLGKLKLLGILGGVLKLKTFATMILSVAAYATVWGWAFALGFVLLIFVHELGHAIVLRREGIPAGAPVFVPFLGAFITMRGRPRDAAVEAKVAIGGPITGSLAAWAVLAAGLALNQPLLLALGHTGILINLFNLIPVPPLDGGRVAGAFTRTFWIVGYAVGVVALFVTRSPILFLILIVGLFTLWQRLRHPIPGYDSIPRSQRLAVSVTYAALLLALVITLPLGHQTFPPIE